MQLGHLDLALQAFADDEQRLLDRIATLEIQFVVKRDLLSAALSQLFEMSRRRGRREGHGQRVHGRGIGVAACAYVAGDGKGRWRCWRHRRRGAEGTAWTVKSRSPSALPIVGEISRDGWASRRRADG